MTSSRVPPLRGLYLVTPDILDTAELIARLDPLLGPDVALLQYRNKLADAGLRREQGRAVLALCRARGVPLVINDSLELVLELGAEGVHLGREDGDPAAARARLPAGAILGVSCYADWARAKAAASVADYVAFGAMFPSPTKPQAAVAGMELLARAQRELPAAVACIGGITLERAPALIAAGADLLAVVSDVFSAPQPRARAAAYRKLFDPDR